MRIALDTNRLTDLFRDDRRSIEAVEGADEVFLPFVVAAEYRVGIAGGTHQRRNEAVLADFIRDDATLLMSTERTITVYAELSAHLNRQGTPIPTNDIWIAAICVEHDLLLFTRDQHFNRLPQVRTL